MGTATLDRPTTTATPRAAPAAAPPFTPGDPEHRCERCGSGHRTLFCVPFRSALDDDAAQRLAAAAGLDCDLHSKLRGATVSAGLRRLDFDSGLFLARGADEDEWRLEGRTWGAPAAGAVRRWHLWAAAAARAVDPTVPAPPAAPAKPAEMGA